MTLVDKTQMKIKQLVIDKKYNSEGFLPSEGELAKMFEVSRATVREAVTSLQTRGFLVRMHGKGIKVANNIEDVMTQTMSDMFDKNEVTLDEILEVRRIIEIPAAGLAAERCSAEDLAAMEQQIGIMEKTDATDILYIIADQDFHLLLVEATKNRTLISLTKAYQPLLYDLIQKSCRFVDSAEKVSHFHRNIFTAIKDHDVQKAENWMRTHLETTQKIKDAIFPSA